MDLLFAYEVWNEKVKLKFGVENILKKVLMIGQEMKYGVRKLQTTVSSF